MVRARAASAAVVLCGVLLALAGCGLRVAPPTPSPAPLRPAKVVAPDYVTVGVNRYADELGNRSFLDAGVGLLVGPHFLIRQQSVGTVREIDDPLARRLGLSDAISAPKGYEFVVADFTTSVGYQHPVPKGGKQPGTLTGGAVHQAVRVGHATRRLDTTVNGGRLLVVAARPGDSVRLQVTDGGRTQSLDLRTGRRVHDAMSRYYPSHDWSPPEPADTDGWTGGYGTLSSGLYTDVELVDVRAQLSPFAPNGQWARKGRAWLYVSFEPQSDCTPVTCRVAFQPRHGAAVHTSPRGSTGHAVGSAFHSVPIQTADSSDNSVVLAFDVRANARAARLVVSQAGAISTTRHGHTVPLRWQDRPPPTTVPLRPHR